MNTVEKLNYVSERDGIFDNGIGIDPDGNELRDHNTGEAIFVDPIITKNDNTINSFLFYDLFSASKHNRLSPYNENKSTSNAIGLKLLEKLLFSESDVITNTSQQLFPVEALEDFYPVMTLPDSNGNFDTHCLSSLSSAFSHGDGINQSPFVALELSILATLLPEPDVTASHNTPIILKQFDEAGVDYQPSEALISTLESHNLIDKFEAFLDNPYELTKNIFAEQYVTSRNITP